MSQFSKLSDFPRPAYDSWEKKLHRLEKKLWKCRRRTACVCWTFSQLLAFRAWWIQRQPSFYDANLGSRVVMSYEYGKQSDQGFRSGTTYIPYHLISRQQGIRRPQNESSLTSCRTVVTTDDITQNEIFYFNISERETKTHVPKLSALVFKITIHTSRLHTTRTNPWPYLHLFSPPIPLYSNPHQLNILSCRRDPIKLHSHLDECRARLCGKHSFISGVRKRIWWWIWRGGNGRRLLWSWGLGLRGRSGWRRPTRRTAPISRWWLPALLGTEGTDMN